MTMAEELCNRIAKLVDELERYKAAVLGLSELKIGNATVVYAFDESIRALLDARDLLKPRDRTNDQ